MIKTISKVLPFALFLSLGSVDIVAQKASRHKRPGPAVAVSQAEKERVKARQELTRATEDYKKSLKELLVLRESSVTRAEAELAKIKLLYAEGLISKHDLEAKEAAFAELKASVAETRSQLTGADVMLSQTLAEADVAIQLAKSPRSTSGIIERTAYFRFDGPARWGLTNAGAIQSFFQSKFHRALPISAFGQTELHNRMGFDHSNAMDVGVNPDSTEGRALIAYLESAGIPFIAFRRAVPGAASGPHIHIGRPSHKL
jgi:hypothetical protein